MRGQNREARWTLASVLLTSRKPYDSVLLNLVAAQLDRRLSGGLLLCLRGEHLDDLVQGQRVRVVGVAHEAGDAGGVADDAPGLVRQVQAHQHIAGELVLTDRLAV